MDSTTGNNNNNGGNGKRYNLRRRTCADDGGDAEKQPQQRGNKAAKDPPSARRPIKGTSKNPDGQARARGRPRTTTTTSSSLTKPAADTKAVKSVAKVLRDGGRAAGGSSQNSNDRDRRASARQRRETTANGPIYVENPSTPVPVESASEAADEPEDAVSKAEIRDVVEDEAEAAVPSAKVDVVAGDEAMDAIPSSESKAVVGDEAAMVTEPSSETKAETADEAMVVVPSTESTQELTKSSSLKMDEEFDIDKLFGTARKEVEEEVVTESSHKKIVEEMSDDEFLKQLPEIDMNQSSAKEQNTQSTSSIAGYALVQTEPEDLSVNPHITQEVLKEYHQNFPKPTMKLKTYSNLKRRLSDIIFSQGSADESSPKRFRMDDSAKENFLFNESSSDDDSYNSMRNESINYSCDDEDTTENELNCTMPFPNLGEDINFDVAALARMHTYARGHLSDKQMQTYLIERSLTAECIEQLYHSLMNIPKDEIEIDPLGIATQLMPHQRQALQWMKWREKQKPSGGILADDMGLGKTIQLISLILANKNETRGIGTDVDMDEEFDDDWGVYDTKEVFEGRTLVICPASLTKQWEREVYTKFKRGSLSVYVYHGESRIISQQKLAKYDIVITTYNLIQQEYDLRVRPRKNKDSRIFKINWERVILDEAHYIRNFKSKACTAVCELTAKSRWALTGTPIQNKELDFYALIKFMRCSPFDEIQVWRRWVSNKNAFGNQRLIVISKSLMLRRTKDELMTKGIIRRLPEKNFDIIEIKLDYQEKLVYQKLLLYSQSFFHEFLRQKKDKEHLKEFGCHARPSLISLEVPDKISKVLKVLMKHHRQIEAHYILVLILRLRQICCHPALIKSMLEKEDLDDVDESKLHINADVISAMNKLMSDDEDDECDEDGDEDCEINEKLAKNIMSKSNPVFQNDRQSSKVRAVLNTIIDIVCRGEKVIVVSQWTSFLDVIASHLNEAPDVKYSMFTGKVAVKDRQEIIDKLNDRDDMLNVLLLSLTAGGVGLNLVGANNLLMIDLHWNPQLETQAQERIYRFGQENNVHIYKFICKDTIEEKIKQLQDKKLQIAQNVLTGTVSNRLTIEDLKLLFS